MTKEMICIVCQNGCRLLVEKNGEEIRVAGAKCRKGEEFGRNEILDPKRVLCTTVKTVFKEHPFLSVKTSKEIPKEMLFPVLEELRKFRLGRKVGIGEVVIADILGTGADLIATEEMEI